MVCHRLLRTFARYAVALTLLLAVFGCRPNSAWSKDLSTSTPVDPTHACITAGDARARFSFAEEREQAGDIATARAVLQSLLDRLRPRCPGCSAATSRTAASAEAQSPSTGPVADPATSACPDVSTWDQRFAIENGFENAGNVAAARGILATALADCNAGVRKIAQDRLAVLKEPPPPGKEPHDHAGPFCPDRSVWNQWFDYADKLAGWKDPPGAWALLIAGLDNCNADVRVDVQKRLINLGNPIDFLKPPAASTTPAPNCKHLADWDERLAYAQKLTEAGDEAGARTAPPPRRSPIATPTSGQRRRPCWRGPSTGQASGNG